MDNLPHLVTRWAVRMKASGQERVFDTYEQAINFGRNLTHWSLMPVHFKPVDGQLVRFG